MRLIKLFFKPKQGKTKKETSTVATGIVPFVGSELGCSKKEAMAYILKETILRTGKNVEDEIEPREVYEVIGQLIKENKIPAMYQLFPSACWNAFWEMGNDGCLEVENQEGKASVKIVPDSILAKIIC